MDWKWICILDGLSTNLNIQVSCRLFSFVISPLEPISKHTTLHEKPRDMMSCTRDEHFHTFFLEPMWHVSKGTVNSPNITDLLAELHYELWTTVELIPLLMFFVTAPIGQIRATKKWRLLVYRFTCVAELIATLINEDFAHIEHGKLKSQCLLTKPNNLMVMGDKKVYQWKTKTVENLIDKHVESNEVKRFCKGLERKLQQIINDEFVKLRV